eukprot:1365268-Amphidinium_carterae.1
MREYDETFIIDERRMIQMLSPPLKRFLRTSEEAKLFPFSQAQVSRSWARAATTLGAVSYTHLRAHETEADL